MIILSPSSSSSSSISGPEGRYVYPIVDGARAVVSHARNPTVTTSWLMKETTSRKKVKKKQVPTDELSPMMSQTAPADAAHLQLLVLVSGGGLGLTHQPNEERPSFLWYHAQ